MTDFAENRVHTELLEQARGAYEWLYFDARSSDGVWTLVAIWLFGNPFSDYSRRVSLGEHPNPIDHNGLYFALHKHGKLYAYHFSRFPVDQIAINKQTVDLSFGPNTLTTSSDGIYALTLNDTNANGRHVTASLQFRPSIAVKKDSGESDPASQHVWFPVAPLCEVIGSIELSEEHNYDKEIISFVGDGYHDHNWGVLPFDPIKEWYWARVNFPGPECLVLYHLIGTDRTEQRSLLRFYSDGTMYQSQNCTISRSLTAPGASFPNVVKAANENLSLTVTRDRALDISPFYTRTLIHSSYIDRSTGKKETGSGVAEVFRPAALTHWLSASAMKARIVQR